MKTFDRVLPIVSFLVLATEGCLARAEVTPYLPSNTVIEIVEFNPQLDMYEIKSPEFHGYGRLYVTPDELVTGVSTLESSRLRRDPRSIVSEEYQLDSDIDIVDMLSEPGPKAKSTASAPKREPASGGGAAKVKAP